MHVFLIAAISIDGFIAEKSDQISTEWTSKEDKQFFRDRTKEAGVIVMGKTTYETIGRPLPNRLNIVYSRSEQSTDLLTLQSGEMGYTNLSPVELLKQLEQAGYTEVAICGGASIYSMFMNAGVVDTLYITVEPIVFGSGVKLFQDLNETQKLELVIEKKLGEQAVVLEYNVIRKV